MKRIGRTLGTVLPALLGLGVLVGCRGTPQPPRPVTQSPYLGRKLVKFVVDNGSPYRKIPLKNGGALLEWRSDFGKLIAVAMGRSDEMLDRCELRLEVDKDQIIRRIWILEDSAKCHGVLK
jgi:hypothetical protein